MSGRLITVVGPSGAGKDTVMRAVAQARPDFVMVRRVITRPLDPGTEDFISCTPAAFEAGMVNGDFALHWRAHGLSYGIPARIRDDLASGRTVVFNGSRGIIPHARDVFPQLQVFVITAPEEVLAARLAARGRETQADIARRLKRASYAMPDDAVEIQNDGQIDAAVKAFLTALDRSRESA